MLDAGYYDEEEYLEHLHDVAENSWEEQERRSASYTDYEENEDDGDMEEYYDEIEMGKYKDWIEKNLVEKDLFITWFQIFRYMDFFDYDYLLQEWQEWLHNPDGCIEELKQCFGSDYSRMTTYFSWKSRNYLEEHFRNPYYETIDSSGELLSKEDILRNQLDDFEEWMRIKGRYEEWQANASTCELEKLSNMVSEQMGNKHPLAIYKEYDTDRNAQLTNEQKRKIIDLFRYHKEEALEQIRGFLSIHKWYDIHYHELETYT